MDVREKLVELLHNSPHLDTIKGYKGNGCTFEQGADWLIDHGVTVQEWISVEDRLPEPKENAICLNRHGDMMIGTYTEWGWMFPCYFEGPTHWMPLPHPLKGE